MPTSANGTLHDNQKKSYVQSPSRTTNDTAQETFVGNQIADNVPTSIYDPEILSAWTIAPSGAGEVAELLRLTGDNFEGATLLTHTWETSTGTGGTASVTDGEAVLQTGVTANNTTSMQTMDRARFITATFNKAHLAISTPDFDNTNVERRWGVYDPVIPIISGDGVFFQNIDGAYSIVRRKGGVDSDTVDEVDFNGGNTLVKNNNVSTYEIVYNAGSAYFFQNRKLIHKMTFIDAVGYETVHLKAGMEVENTNGNTTNNIIKTRGFAVSRIGSSSSVNRKFRVSGAGSGAIANTAAALVRIVITGIGTGNSTIALFDSDDSATNLIVSVDLTKALTVLEFGSELGNGLSYLATGSNFEVIIIYN